MDFNKRLEAALNANKMTAKELTEHLEIGRTTVNDWKRGKSTPSPNALIGISHILGVSLDWLLKGEGEMYKKHSPNQSIDAESSTLFKKFSRLDELDKARVIERIDTLIEKNEEARSKKHVSKKEKLTVLQSKLKPEIEEEIAEIDEMIEMPVSELHASAGLGNYLLDDSPFEMMLFDADDVPDDADFGIRIAGDSMEPSIHDEQIVWVKEQVQIDNGQIGIFILNGEAYCKKLEIDYDEREMRLVSLNKVYDPIILKSTPHLKTVGRVLM